MAKKPLKGFPKSDAQKMLDRLSAPRVQKYADGGLTNAPVIAPKFLSSKDKAQKAEFEKRIAEEKAKVDAYNAALEKYNAEKYNPYKAKVDEYNAALDKYNAEIYNPYKAKVDAYNTALEAHNKLPLQQFGGNYVPGSGASAGRYYDRNYYNAGGGLYIPRAPAAGDYLANVNQYNTFTIKPGYYYENGYIKGRPGFNQTAPSAPTPFALTAPQAPDPFGMQKPEQTLKQEEIDAFVAEAQKRAESNASARANALRAVQDPSRFNLGSFGTGDIGGMAGTAGLAETSTSLFNQGGEVKNENESMASKMLKEVVPLDTRTFVSTLFGNRDPITEQNLNPEQIMALREVVQTAEQKGRKGNVQYSDYEKFKAGPEHNPHISLENTLGRFNYVRNPDGSLTVTDRYDFVNPQREEAIQAYENMGPARKALEVAKRSLSKPFTFPLTLASELGNAYIGREGRDVKINVPPSESKKMMDSMKKAPKK